MPDLFTDQLSAYLDGELDPIRRRRLELHLGECRECASVLAELRALVAAAPFYQGRQPARDVWPGIRERLGDADVVPIADRSERPPRSRRFSWPQLIAASLTMAVLGAGGAWFALRSPAGEDSPTPGRAAATSIRTVAAAETQYEAAIAELTRIVEAGRGSLDTATVRVIDQSLRKIDAAIADARAAIQRDSTNVYLNRQVTANMRRKLTLLRFAADAIART